MLEVLATKDSFWRKIAFSICKDRMLADDLVNEMYLKLADCTKEINDFYVIVTIKNLFLQEIKGKKTVSIEKFYNFTSSEVFELDDFEKEVIDNIYWVAREYIERSEKQSLREMGKELNTNYAFIYRTIKKEKEKWQNQKDLATQSKR